MRTRTHTHTHTHTYIYNEKIYMYSQICAFTYICIYCFPILSVTSNLFILLQVAFSSWPTLWIYHCFWLKNNFELFFICMHAHTHTHTHISVHITKYTHSVWIYYYPHTQIHYIHMIRSGWVLWHINHWRLFNAKSSLYIYQIWLVNTYCWSPF